MSTAVSVAPLESESLVNDATPSDDTNSLPTFSYYAGIFLLSSSVLLFEVAATRIFAVLLWSNLAFMVISTALFGFGLSGVALALWDREKAATKEDIARYVLYSALAIPLAYIVITNVPFRMWQFREAPINFLYFAIWISALILPFFFAGLAIATLLSSFRKGVGKLYGFDLVGAATGSLIFLVIIPVIGAEGTVMVAALAATIAAAVLGGGNKRLFTASICLSILFLALVPFASKVLPLKFQQQKRRFQEVVNKKKILGTRWSALSRVDIADKLEKGTGPAKHIPLLGLWIDGGTNASMMLKWNGDLANTAPLHWSSVGEVYALKGADAKRVLVIGSSGGREVLFALSHGASHVDAVEMDPSIVKFLKEPRFSSYMGHIFESDKVNLVNDEGRAFLRRMPPETYDTIQFVNNYSPGAIAAGALNLSETFLLTREAFDDFLDRLTPNGVIALHRGATLRVALTAVEALRARGIQNPEKHILITEGEFEAFQGILIKKSPWTQEEVSKIREYLEPLTLLTKQLFLWNPTAPSTNNVYGRVLSATKEKQVEYYHGLGVELSPVSDDRPFLEHFTRYGHQELSPEIPPEFGHREQEKWGGVIPRGDFPYVAIMVEAAFLALLFVGVPLLWKGRIAGNSKGFWGYVGFFSCLGFSFIIIEICLMKRFILFLGDPAYSMTTILVVLLLGAGVGSMLVERIREEKLLSTLSWSIAVLCVALLFETSMTPYIFRSFLHLELLGRVLVATSLLFPLGVLLGVPFPTGMRLIYQNESDKKVERGLIAWAWGVNGYTTVIGSAATVFIALFLGFTAAMIVAAAGYIVALISIRSAVLNRPIIRGL